LNPSYNSDNDLQELLLGNTARTHDVKVAVSGGQKGLTYYSSLNYLDDKGIALNSWAKTLQGRINVDYQATPKFKYTSSISYSWQKKNATDINGSVRPVFDRPNNLRIFLPDGSLTSYLNSKRNPVANALLLKDEGETWSGQFNNNLAYDIIKGLRFNMVANAALRNTEEIFFQPRFLDDNGNENDGRNKLGKRFNWEVQSYLNYNKTFKKDHVVSATLGVSADRTNANDYTLEGLKASFVNEEIFVINGSNIDLTGSKTTATTYATASLFARANYSYLGRYIGSLVFRRDGSTRFGANSKWGNFLSGSAAWRVSDEKFMDWSKSFLADAKLRYSYGSLGNDRIGDFEFSDLIIFGTGSYNGIGSAYLDSKKGNADIRWENTVTQNLGADLSFLNGKLGLTTEYYIKTTEGLLANRELPKETGFTQQRVNFGTIQNRGLELVLSATPVSKRGFSWNLSGNITFERGRIKDLYGGQQIITDDDKHLLTVGGKVGDFYGWKHQGIYRWDASNAYSTEGMRLEPRNVSADGKTAEYYLNGQLYNVIWRDLNNDAIIDDADRHVIGNSQPDCYLGLVNNVRLGQLSLSFILNSTIGGQVYNNFKLNLTNNSSSNGPALPEAIYGSWKQQGDIAEYPNFVNLRSRGNEKASTNSYFLEDASFIRLSSARLTYNISSKLAKRLLMKSANIFMYGTNIATWTNYTGYDPEFSSSILTSGVDGGKYPKVRQLGLGLNIAL
jgi:TonB-linked SusC/RagA family outer membrane protein